MSRTVVWSGQEDWFDGWHAEFAQVDLGGEAMQATGTQLGVDPVPYRLEYTLDATGEGLATRSLRVEAAGEGWERRLVLERDDAGGWTIETGSEGEVELTPPGGDAEPLSGALDCDLGNSPLTNTMPARRHALQREPGRVDFLMAWVSVPDLGVHPLRQRYEHVRPEDEGAIVRYSSVEDGSVTFTSDLQLDAEGLVLLYPKLARRVG